MTKKLNLKKLVDETSQMYANKPEALPIGEFNKLLKYNANAVSLENRRYIKDYKTYNDRMDKSMIDKLFFLDKIPNKFCLVDLGCADGSLIRTIEKNFQTNGIFVGYDNDEKMINFARENNKPNTNNKFTSDWKVVCSFVRDPDKGRKSVLVLSSIIHEIFSYCTIEEVSQFWERVFNTGFDYIVIRDMIPSQHIDRPSDVNDIAKVYKRHKFGTFWDFESTWGSIENNKNLVHYLLKYRYTEPNWDRELKENYIPISREKLLTLIPVERYEITYHEHYVLPYNKEKIQEDFGIELKDPTHLKLILRRK